MSASNQPSRTLPDAAAHPGAALRPQHGSAHPESAHPESAQPESAHPGTSEPGTSEIGSAQSGSALRTTAAALRRTGPGMVLVAAVALASQVAGTHLRVVSALLIAIIVGVVWRNTVGIPAWARPGVTFSTRTWLRTGVVLLGFQLSLPQVAALGWRGIVVIVVTVSATYWATVGAGTLLRVPRLLTRLVATGFSICGAAAIAAASGILDPEGEHEEDTATAVALVTLFGTVMIAVMPALASACGFSSAQAGMWIGASVHEVAQVVAAGTIAGSAALAVATVTKLGRVVLLAPVAFGQSVGVARAAKREETSAGARAQAHTGGAGATPTAPAKRPPLVPLFVVGFLVAMAVRSTGWVPAVALHDIQLVATFLLAGAMFCLGTGVHLRTLARTGWRAATLGAISTLVAVGCAGLIIAAVH